MKKSKSLRKRTLVINILLLITLAYFTYHSIIGNRGFIQLRVLKSEIKEKTHELEEAQKKRQHLEQQTNLLYDKKLDKDFIDELARKNFGLIGKKEKMLIMPKE